MPFSAPDSQRRRRTPLSSRRPEHVYVCIRLDLPDRTNTCDDLDVRSAIPFNDSIETFCSRDCFHIATRLQKHKMVASCPLFSFGIACHPAAQPLSSSTEAKSRANTLRCIAFPPFRRSGGLTLPLAHQRQRNGAQQALFQIPIQPLSAARAWSMSFFSVSACFSSVIAPTMGSPTILPLRSTT